MARRRVFIKEINAFATEVDVTLTVSGDIDSFLSVWDLETLQKLLKTQLEHEKYEVAANIQKQIELKQSVK